MAHSTSVSSSRVREMVLWVSSTRELQEAVQDAQSAGLQDALLNSSLIYLILSDLIVDLRFPNG